MVIYPHYINTRKKHKLTNVTHHVDWYWWMHIDCNMTHVRRVNIYIDVPPNHPLIAGIFYYKPSLVGGDWNMNSIFPYIGNVIIPIDELIFFRGVGWKTTNQKPSILWGIPHDYGNPRVDRPRGCCASAARSCEGAASSALGRPDRRSAGRRLEHPQIDQSWLNILVFNSGY